MKNILALDLSKRCTGFAFGTGNMPPTTFSVGFYSVMRSGVMSYYERWIRDRLLTNDPDLVAYEKPMMAGKGSANTRFILVGLAAITEMVCYNKNVQVVDVGVSTWRKAFLGHGFPDDPKSEAVQMCARLGWKPSDTDAAEACGVWAWAHLHHGDHDAMRDQLSRAKVRAMEGQT